MRSLELLELLLSLVDGLEFGLVAVLENCAQIGVSAGPSEDEGGVLFSFSLLCAAAPAYAVRSLLERFILPNIADRLVEDLVFLGFAEASPVLVGTFVSLVSVRLESLEAFAAVGRLEGEDGGDCTFD